MDIVKVSGILMVEKDAAIPVVSGVFRTPHAEGENKVAQFDILDQGDVVGATDLGFVAVFARVDPENLVSVDLAMGPTFRVGEVPAFSPLFKIFAENERPFLSGKKGAGENRKSDKERNKFFHGMRVSVYG
jgi:hypothetical protein